MARILLGLIAGLFAGAALALALCIAAAWMFNITQAEGAYAMGVAFFYMPAGALLGALLGGLVAWLRR